MSSATASTSRHGSRRMAEPGGICVSAARHAQRRQGAARALRADRPTAGEEHSRAASRSMPFGPPRRRRASGSDRRLGSRAGGRRRWLLALAALGVWGLDGELACRPSPSRLQAGEARPSRIRARADTRPVVAVLPFDNLSGDPAQAYFADGLTEDIITDLASNRDLIGHRPQLDLRLQGPRHRHPRDRRRARRRLCRRRQRAPRRRPVARRRAADRCQSGAHLWSRSYDRRVEDVFAVQADLTAQIVASLVSYVRQSESAAAVEPADRKPRAPTTSCCRRAAASSMARPAEQALLDARALFTARHRRSIPTTPPPTPISASPTSPTRDRRSPAGRRRATSNLGLAEAREAIRLEPDLALGYQVLSFGLAASGDYEASSASGRARGRAQSERSRQPHGAGQGAGPLRRLRAKRSPMPSAPGACIPWRLNTTPMCTARRSMRPTGPPKPIEVLADCLLGAPQEPNCLKIRAAALVRLGRMDEARESMARSSASSPSSRSPASASTAASAIPR